MFNLNRKTIRNIFILNKYAQTFNLLENEAHFLELCLDKWEEPHRYYHGINHLSNLMEQLFEHPIGQERYYLEILALFHDVVYNPKFFNNEELSIEFIKKHVDPTTPLFEKLCVDILLTKYNRNILKGYTNQELFDSEVKEQVKFWQMDLKYLSTDNCATIIKNELMLLKEFQFLPYRVYKNNRLNFLTNFEWAGIKANPTIIDYVRNYRPKIGIYAGSFNPFHNGHMDILEQAEKIFDKVIVAIGRNPYKNVPNGYYSKVVNVLPFHEVAYYDTLLSEFLQKQQEYADVTLIRGLRSGYDLDYEMNQKRVLEDCDCDLPVAYFICNKKTAHISSSMIRGLEDFTCDMHKIYIPQKFKYARSTINYNYKSR